MRGAGGWLVPLAGGKDGLKPSASAFYRSAVSAVLDSSNGFWVVNSTTHFLLKIEAETATSRRKKVNCIEQNS